MGYYTDFTITIPEGWTGEKLSSEITNVSDYNLNDLNDFDDGTISLYLRWYDYSEDMHKLSLKYPDTLFTIEGNGEDRGDIWKEYHLGGKSYIDVINLTFPEFDKNKLI